MISIRFMRRSGAGCGLPRIGCEAMSIGPDVSRVSQPFSGLFFCVLLTACLCAAQQHPAVLVGGPSEPKGCVVPFEDSRGMLWLAGCETGQEGILSFDGAHFLAPEGQIPGAVVRGMSEDTEGGIWLSSTRGLYRIYRGKIQRIFDGMALAGIVRVAPDVFLLTMRRQSSGTAGPADAVRVSMRSGEWRIDSVLRGISDVQFSLDKSGHILYGCNGGYCELSADEVIQWQEGKQIQIRRYDVSTGGRFADGSSAVFRDRSGCVWLRSSNDAAYQCPGDARAKSLPAGQASGYPQIYELQNGQIMIPSFSRLAIGRPRSMFVLPFTSCSLVIPLRDGGLLTNGTDGLTYFPQHLGVEFWTEAQGLSGITWSLFGSGSRMYVQNDVSTRVLGKDRGSWHLLRGPAGRMAPGPAGTILVASSAAVFQMTPDWKVQRQSPPANIQSVSRVRDDEWLAGGDGLYQLEIGKRSLGLKAVPSSARQQGVVSIKAGPDRTVWACSQAGISRRDATGWNLLPMAGELSNSGCGSFAIESGGSIWYSPPTDNSLQLIENPESGSPHVRSLPSTMKTGQQSHIIAIDHRGWIWRGTTDGLDVADGQEARLGQWIHLDKRDGLPTLNANRNSFFEDADGSIWYGADNDVIHITPPTDLVHPKLAPAVIISAFASNGDPPRMTDGNIVIKSGASVTAQIGSLQFDRRNALHFRYRLLPHDTEWTDTSSFDLHLGEPRWGHHALQVQAQLATGPWSEIETASFDVLRPVWLSWPALIGFVSGGGVIFAGARRWSKKHKARLRKAFPDVAEWRLAALSPELQQLDGTLLDSRFEVGRILARGGFAVVAEGRDFQQEGRRCAIKIFRKELVDKAWMKRRFNQEVLALSQIAHPNVVRIYGSGTLPGETLYLAMEFIDGATLRELLETGKLNPRQISSYLRQAGCALNEIHAHGICHRDLKPENIMIRTNASPGQELVLIDFSIAIVKDPDETLHGLSRAAGTIYYMAPEQAIGYADPSTDIYSLAKILIEMLTGERLSTLLPDASMDLPDRVRELLGRLPLGLSSASTELFVSALVFDPAHRPKNAGLFADQIASDLELNTAI